GFGRGFDHGLGLSLGDASLSQETLNLAGNRAHILAVVLPHASGPRTLTRQKLGDAASVLIHDISQRRVRTLIHVVSNPISITVSHERHVLVGDREPLVVHTSIAPRIKLEAPESKSCIREENHQGSTKRSRAICPDLKSRFS